MKRNLFRHIPVFTLALILCVFSFVRLQAGVKNFTPTLYSELTRLQTKSVHIPDSGCNSAAADLFEKETEDENETEFHASLPIVSHSQSFYAISFPVKSFTLSSSYFDFWNTQGLLYLIIRSIRT